MFVGPRNDIPAFADEYGNLPAYAQHGFISLQFAVNLFVPASLCITFLIAISVSGITQVLSPNEALTILETVQMQRIPYPRMCI